MKRKKSVVHIILFPLFVVGTSLDWRANAFVSTTTISSINNLSKTINNNYYNNYYNYCDNKNSKNNEMARSPWKKMQNIYNQQQDYDAYDDYFDEYGNDSSQSNINNNDDDDDSTVVHDFLATCAPGLASVLEYELIQILSTTDNQVDGSDYYNDDNDNENVAIRHNIERSGRSAVTFAATPKQCLKVLLWVRSANTVLQFVASTSPDRLLYDRNDLHDFIMKQVNVKQLLGDGKGGLLTLSVRAKLNNLRRIPKDLSHSHFTALTIKNALCDAVRNLRGDRPSVDTKNPQVPLVAIFLGDDNTLGASLTLFKSVHPSGSLHRRGYRSHGPIHKAALRETLAAGLLFEAQWDQLCRQRLKTVKNQKNNAHDEQIMPSPLIFIDPMAGSGSLVIEAAMIAANLAPGLLRIKCGMPSHSLPPILLWKDSSNPQHNDDNNSNNNKSNGNDDLLSHWKQLLLDATKCAKEGLSYLSSNDSLIEFHANDIHGGALDLLEASLAQSGFSNIVNVYEGDCFDLTLDSAFQNEQQHQQQNGDNTNNNPIQYVVMTNPPWGVRLTQDIQQSWENLRHFLRDKCPNPVTAWILSGNKSTVQLLKLKRERMFAAQTGRHDIRWIQYMIHSKPQRQDEESFDMVNDDQLIDRGFNEDENQNDWYNDENDNSFNDYDDNYNNRYTKQQNEYGTANASFNDSHFFDYTTDNRSALSSTKLPNKNDNMSKNEWLLD